MRRTAAVLTLLLAVACRREAPKAEYYAPTDEQAKAFAGYYLDALQKPDAERAALLIDWDALIDKATSDAGIENELFRQAFVRGAKKKANGPEFVKQLSDVMRNGGSLHLLRVRTAADGSKRAVFRLLLPDGAVNYHEMLISRDAAGAVRARDIYVYTNAEFLTDTMRRMFFFSLAQDPSALQKLAGRKNPFLEHVEDYKQMLQKLREGDGKGAEEMYRRLPEETRRQKSVMLAHVFASSKLGNDEAYLKAMDEMRRAFPHDGGVDLMSIDAFILKQKWPEALAAIDRVDAAVGGDPYLDVFRSNVLLRSGDVKKAHDFSLRAGVREPTLPAAYWAQVHVSLARHDYAETARLLSWLRDHLRVEIADLTTLPDYAGFVASPEYEEWMKR
ncbi:MAG TPA: hypothetical protein VJ276_00295 [Thermoanaerobaculia bacterium]|nr:hypothetical protein [Thermoanaerobaculia bacterium]